MFPAKGAKAAKVCEQQDSGGGLREVLGTSSGRSTRASRLFGTHSGLLFGGVVDDGRLVLRPTKTVSSDAVLPLPEPCVHALAQHRLMVERWRADAGIAWHENDLVFSTRYGLPLDPRNFHRRFKVQARKADVPVVSVHSTKEERAPRCLSS